MSGRLRIIRLLRGRRGTVVPKIRHVLEYLRPGSIFFWDGDGAMTHEEAMRSLRLMGEEVIPAVKEMAVELELPGPFEVDPGTGEGPAGGGGCGGLATNMGRLGPGLSP